MDVSGLIKAIFAPDLDRVSQPPATLKAGDRLIGRVLEIRPNGLTLMDFGSFRALADIRFQVAPGQRMPLEVVDAPEPIQLRLLEAKMGELASTGAVAGDSPNALQQAGRTLSSGIAEVLARASGLPEAQRPPEGVQAALDTLNNFFLQVDLTQDLPQIMDRLESLIQNGGHLFEKKLAEAIATEPELKNGLPAAGTSAGQAVAQIVKNDLKPNLLLVKDFLDQQKTPDLLPDAKTLTGLKEAIDRLIGDIQQQTSSLRHFGDSEPVQVFFHLLPFLEKSRAAGLKVYYSRRRKGTAPRHPMVSLLLDMDRLGAIRTDFLLIQNDLSVTFYVQEAGVKQSLESQGDEIRSSLQPFVDHLTVRVVVSEKKIASFRATHQPKADDRQVDVMA